MKVTFLGTGTSQGVPVIACGCKVCRSTDPRDNRLRTSLMIETGNTVIIFDAGPDFRQQMLRENVMRVDAIVLTHEHRDHISGMDDVRAFNYKTSDAIDIYAENRVLEEVKREYSYVFREQKYPGVPEMRLNPVSLEPFRIKEVEIIPLRVFHLKLPVLGFRIGNFAYITDANLVPDETKEKLFGVKWLVINALRKEKHISHFSLFESINLIKEVSPRQAFLTHISHQMGLYAEISKELPHGIELAYDTMTLN
ncbi:MAG TPA: MBL fold metallo-hydrolase, partial [Bacteroidales bacterium]|nr:MBL fold metallo-hydrolase [Bacteroidales bacterium]